MRDKLRHIILAVITFTMAMVAMPLSAQVNTEQVMRIGVNAMSFDDYILAIQYFNQAIQAKPYMARPYHMRAIAKYNLDDFAGAESDATKALEINPYITEVYRLRGAARQNIGRYAQAIEDYDRALEADPDDQRVLFNKGLALAAMDKYADADTIFGHLIRRSPGMDIAYFGRANVNIAAGDTVAAERWLEKGIEINPNDFNAHIMRYQIAAGHGDNDTALAAIDKAIQLSPRNTDLYIARANLRYAADDYFGAMADYTYALELDPGNDRALYNRALLRTEVQDLDNALLDYESILETDPDNDLAIYNHAMILAQKGDYKKAVDGISRFIELYPGLSTSYFVRSQWLLALGRKAAAKADYDKGRELADYRSPIRRQIRKKSKLEKKHEEESVRHERDTVPTDIEELTPEEFERRLTTMIEVSNDTGMDVQYDNSAIRGLIQNRNFTAETEPYMLISFYPAPSELQRKTYYLREADDLNATHILRKPLAVTPQPAQPSAADIQGHFASVEYFNSALATGTPRSADYIGRAMDFITLKNYEAAISDIDRALAITPGYALAYLLRAQARVSAAPDDATPRSTIVRVALADLDQAIALSPRNAVAWYNKGNMLFELGDYTSAILAYTKAIEYQPDMGEAFFNRGYASLKLGNSSSGKADLSKAGELGIVPAYNLMKRIATK